MVYTTLPVTAKLQGLNCVDISDYDSHIYIKDSAWIMDRSFGKYLAI